MRFMTKILTTSVALLFLVANTATASIPRTTKVSSNDATDGYLNGKLVAGAGVTFTENNDGVDETLTIATASMAPSSATFITQTSSASLSNEQALTSLPSSGIMKVASATGVVSIASAGTDYVATEVDPTVDTSAEIQAIIGAGVYQAPLTAGVDYLEPTGSGAGLSGVVTSESDPIVGAITGIVKADGAGNISVASAATDYQAPIVAGVDYLAPNGSGAGLSGVVTTESDPIFVASAAYHIETADITNLGNLSGTNSGDITLAGTASYVTLSGQQITRNAIDLSDESDIDGNLAVAHLNSGTNADATTFWRGDGAWVAPAGTGDVIGVGDCTDGACLDGTSDGGTTISLYDGDSNKTTITAGDSTVDLTLVLPTASGSNGNVLTTNGAGTLSWAAAGGFDSTTIDATAWSDGANASNAWTFDVSGTDTTQTAGNGTMGFSHNLTVGGDLTITGDDLFMTTNTSGAVLVADGTNYNPVVMSGDASIAVDGSVMVASDSHAHTGSTLSGIDISDDTNLSGDTEAVLTGDALSIGTGITRDTEWDTWAELPALTDTHILVGNGTNDATDVAMSGDASILNTGELIVASDSHAHTGSTLSGIDISDDTNLTAGDHLTLTGDDLDVDDDFLINTGDTLSGTLTLAENSNIALDPAGSADGKYSGMTMTGTAGATLEFGDLIYLDPTDSRWELADANVAAGADGDPRGILGLCVASAANDGSATTILLKGIARADGVFPALTINAPVYVGETAGDIVVTQPTTADVVIRVAGFATTADEIYFNPSDDYLTHV
jgi:hypothetical protein